MPKVKLNYTQINQMKNISDTLIEATEHFISQIKNREFSQSIHLFSSIVEGYEAILKMSTIYENDIMDLPEILNKIEDNLVLIANHLEKEELLKINEIVQFSLVPNFRKLDQIIELQTINGAKVTIGFYHGKVNPKKVYPKERIEALVKEGQKQHANTIFFTSEDINFETKEICGDILVNGNWKKTTCGFPDVIHNVQITSRHHQSITERKLRRVIPFTSFGVGNKFSLPKIMVKHKRFAKLLVPFQMINNIDIVFDYLSSEKIAVLKPILGARGESIYFVQKKGNRFLVSEHRHEKIYNYDNFYAWIESKILNKKFSYMIQRYIECHTKDREPFDIRAHMQKDGKGNWIITKIYPRIGSKHSILSNISRGGRTENLKTFLIEEFGSNTGENHNKELRKLSLDLSKYLDRIHNFSLDEIGLDLAIDNTGRFWLHEANNGPQSTYHEEKRAINTIGYAKYIANKGIVKQNEFQNSKGQFNAKVSKHPFAEINNRYSIGMLKSQNDSEKLAVACAYVAHYENVQFYTFTPRDIDYNEMLIKGQFYEDGEWVSRIVEYPDVIYDRFRLRGVKGYTNVYEELDGIPFTNEFYGNSISKLEVYDKLLTTGKLDDVIIPYKRIDKLRDIFEFIEEYEAVIIKPEVGSFAKGVHYISKMENNNYFVAEGNQEKEYSELSLRRYLNDLLNSGIFIVQQYINTRTIDGQPFDIRVHIMKDGKSDWSFVDIYPRIGVRYATISATDKGGYIGKLSGFLDRNFSENQTKKLKQAIKTVAMRVTQTFSTLYNESFNEIALDIALDNNGSPHLIEANINKPGIINFEFDLARHVIPYSIHLASIES